MQYNLAYLFYESSLAHPENLALAVGDTQFTYAGLREKVQPIAGWLRAHSHSKAPRVGILASRTPETYLGILGTSRAGGTYIPLSDKCFPMLACRRWYRTGDLAYRDASGIFHHLGRIDNQVRVLGLRVEPEEIEAHLSEVYETDSVAAK